MDSRREGGTHLVRLDPGEDVIEALTRYCADRGILSATATGIGAVRDVEVGAFVCRTGAYEKVTLPGEWELLSLDATISRVDGGPFVHAHAVLGNAAAETRGGHLFSARVTVTAEMAIRETGIAVSREKDEASGLRLWRFPPASCEGKPRG